MSHHLTLSGIFLLLLTLLTNIGNSADSSGQAFNPVPIDVPQKGVFLVAERNMPDPRFQHSVILLLVHGAEGTLGVIINRPTEIVLSEAVPDLEGLENREHRLFFGGPVAMESLLFLVYNEIPPEPVAHVLGAVHWGMNRTVLESLLAADKPDSELRIYFGRAGWAPGQLDAELMDGSWRLFRAPAEIPFDQDPATLWDTFMDGSGQRWIMASTET